MRKKSISLGFARVAVPVLLFAWLSGLPSTAERQAQDRQGRVNDTRIRAQEQRIRRQEEIERIKEQYGGGESVAPPQPRYGTMEDRWRDEARLWGIQYVPPTGPGYSGEARSQFVRAITDRERRESQKGIAASGGALRKKNAQMYFDSAERAGGIREKAHNYKLAADLVKEFPDAVFGQTACSIFTKAANLYRSDPGARGADQYFFKAKLSDPQNGDWPLLIAEHNWDRNVDISEKFLKECLNCPRGSAGTQARARDLLARVPAQRQAQEAAARAMAAAMNRVVLPYSFGSSGSTDHYIEDVYKAGASSYGSESAKARKDLGWD